MELLAANDVMPNKRHFSGQNRSLEAFSSGNLPAIREG
jgi:hypothetical protein